MGKIGGRRIGEGRREEKEGKEGREGEEGRKRRRREGGKEKSRPHNYF